MSTDASRLPRTAWLVVGLLWPVALLNYLDRQMLAAMKSSIQGDIPTITADADWGMVLASFKWVYAAFSPIGGYIADRFSKRWIIVGSLFIWSGVTWLTGHTNSYWEMIFARGLMGVSEAFYIPAALALIADYHSGETRSRAIGIHQMAIYCGVMLGGTSGYVAQSPDFGWRWAFAAAGLAGVLYTLPLAIFLPRPPRREANASAGPNPRQAAAELLTNRNFFLLVLCFTLPAMAGWVVKDWMPSTLKQQLNIDQGLAGITATFSPNIAAFVGALVGGWWADRLMRRYLHGRIYVSALGLTLLIPSLLAVSLADSVTAAAVVLAVFGFGWGFFDCNNMPILSQIVRPELRATGYGIMNFVSISCGGLADWAFGKLLDLKVPLPLIFGTFAAVAMVSVALMLLIRPRDELTGGPAGA
jgi:MFS family permease